MKQTVVIYGEAGQYCTAGYAEEVQTCNSPRAIKVLLTKYANKWGSNWDNWGGFHPARTVVFAGTMKEFEEKYPNLSEPHYITGSQYRLNVMDDLFDYDSI